MWLLAAVGQASPIDTLDINYIDKLYVREPQRAYRLLAPALKRQEREHWKNDTRMHYERVAGYVCLGNNRYAEALKHAFALNAPTSKDELDRLMGLELQCNVMELLGQYEQMSRVATEIKEGVDNMGDHDPKTWGTKVFFTLYYEYYKIQALSSTGKKSEAMQALRDARTLLAKCSADPDAGVRNNCAIMRHALDVQQADIYLDNGMVAEAAQYIPEVIAALEKEQRLGGDGITDKAGYDIHRIELNLRLALALAKSGNKAEAVKAADSAQALMRNYSPASDALGRLLEVYVTTGHVPAAVLNECERYYRSNRATPSVELALICNNLLYYYIQQGHRDKAMHMYNEAQRVNDHLNRVNMEFYNVMSENSALRTAYYKQRVHKMVAIGLALASIIFIVMSSVYRHRRLRDSEYLYKFVKLAAQRAPAPAVAKAAPRQEDEQNLVQRIEAALLQDDIYLNASTDFSVVEDRLKMRRQAITQELSETYNTTLGEILTDLRLQHACKLLETTDYVLEYVAMQSGFGTSRTFYRAFKKKYNLTPTEYRNLGRTARAQGQDRQ